ncbi:hypothetical protein D3C81_1501630 [compost metagenome]
MQGDVAFSAHPLFEPTHLVEAVDRRDHRLSLVIDQHRTVHQSHRTLTALTLTPALGGTDHLASVQVDVEAAIAERSLDFTQGRCAAQLIQQLTDRIA